MNKKTTGILLGLGAGLGVALLIRKRLLREAKEVHLTVCGLPGGGCEIQTPVEDVELYKHHGDFVKWIISNPEEGGCGEIGESVSVSVRNWKKNTLPAPAPVFNVLGLSRRVKRGGPPKTMVGTINPLVDEGGDFKYDVYIDESNVLDPIVKLVL
jgi:hypothetical protein